MESVFLILCLIQLTCASTSDANSFRNDTLVPPNDTHRGERKGLNEVTRIRYLENYASHFTSIPYEFEERTVCKLHVDILKEEAKKLNIWALKIIDASAKLPSGILSGNLNQYGDFDECISSSVILQNQTIKGKYCLSTIGITMRNDRNIDDLIHSHRMFTNEITDAGHRIPKLETFNWGVCLPHSCTNGDLRKALQAHFNRLTESNHLQINVLVNENMCFEEGERKFATVNQAAVLFFIVIIAIAVLATLIDTSSTRPDGNRLIQYLKCFSLKRNFSALLRTDHSADEIMSLHGVRFLNAIALLLSHKQMAMLFNPITNRTQMTEMMGQPWSMIGRSAILYTDSFILLSGLLLSYGFVKELDQKCRIDFRSRFISRLFRFTPNLLALVVFCTFIMEHLGSGPQWGLVVKQYADLCKQNMWQNFLYIHNYFGFEKMCLTHTHQLGIDMQLFLISPIIIYILWRNRRNGLALLIVLGIASTCLRYHVTVKEKISTLIYFGISVDRLWKTASLSYILPTHRLTVYVVGIALGYFLRRNGRKLQLPYLLKWVGWIVATSCGLIAMFGPYHVSSRDYVYDVRDAALYNAFSPILWIIFVSWTIIACENGWGGWFNKFLSWKYFTIFTRISYALYLTQFPVFFYGVGTQRSNTFYKGLHSMIDLPEFLLIFAMSVLMTVLFDLPFQNLRKTYLNNSRGPPTRKKSTSGDEVRSSIAKDYKTRRRLENVGH